MKSAVLFFIQWLIIVTVYLTIFRYFSNPWVTIPCAAVFVIAVCEIFNRLRRKI